MTRDEVLALIAAGGVPYSQVRDQIRAGDLLALHHEFVMSWYGCQIEAVQAFTGPFAHIAMFEWVKWAGVDRLIVAESVVPRVRGVAVSVTAEKGFFWIAMGREPSTEAHQAIADAMGTGEYSKEGAILAGLDRLPPDEDADPRQWCAKRVNLWARSYGLDLGRRYVPSDMVAAAIAQGGRLQYVRMQ